MRVLFVITHLGFWMPLEPIAQRFSASGHTVRVLLDKKYGNKFANRFLFDPDNVPYNVGWQSHRKDGLRYFLRYSREVLNYAAYWRLRQPTSKLLVDRWAIYLYPFRFLTYSKLGRTLLSSNLVWNLLKKLERVAPPSKYLIKELKQFNPDVVVAASAIMAYSNETDYLKAARHLGIPTVVIIPSWDNLTTKGILHEIPDWLFVWTEAQVEEAERYHSVPRERVVCTGAPKYDDWFELKPSITKKEFCQEVGINPSNPYALYLCSSGFISGDETVFIDQLADRLAQTPELRDLTLLIRPHPLNLDPWKNYKAKYTNIIIWPRDMLILNPSMIMQDLYHSILYSDCVLGVNTSAFIEAATVDKPCIAITASHYELTQMGIPHFKHLLDAGFLELPRDFGETADIIKQIVKGIDKKKNLRSQFVHYFVRPKGLKVQATDVVAQAIESVAQGKLP